MEEVARFGDPFEVFVLDPKRNGIEQIARILQDYQGVQLDTHPAGSR